MSSLGNQLGQQIKTEAKKVVADVADSLKNLPGDLAKSAVEEVGISTGGTDQQNNFDEQIGTGNVDPQKLAEEKQKKTAHKRRLQELRRELAEFRQKKKQKASQEEQVKEQKKMRELEKKESEKSKRARGLIKMIQRAYGGSGEGGKPVG